MPNLHGGPDIFPSYIMRTTNSDGTTTTSSIYTLEAIANQNILLIFLCIIGAAFLAPFAAILLAVLYIISCDKAPKLLALIGVAVCVYLLYDIKHAWIMSTILNVFANPIEKFYVIRVTMSMLLVHSILLLFGRTLYTLAFKEKVAFLLYLVGIWVACYYVGIFILTHFVKINFA